MTWDPTREIQSSEVTGHHVVLHAAPLTNQTPPRPITDEMARIEVYGGYIEGRLLSLVYSLKSESASLDSPQLVVEPVGVTCFMSLPYSALAGLLLTVQQPGAKFVIGTYATSTSLSARRQPPANQGEVRESQHDF